MAVPLVKLQTLSSHSILMFEFHPRWTRVAIKFANASMEKSKSVSRFLASHLKLVKLATELLSMDLQSQSNATLAHASLKKLLALKANVEFMEFPIVPSRHFHAIVRRILCLFVLETEKLIHQHVSRNVQGFMRLNLNSDRARVKIHASATIVLKERCVFLAEMFVCRICTIHVRSIDVVSDF